MIRIVFIWLDATLSTGQLRGHGAEVGFVSRAYERRCFPPVSRHIEVDFRPQAFDEAKVVLMIFRFLHMFFIGPAFLHPPRGGPICRHTWFHEPFLSRKYSGEIRVRFGLLHRVISTVRRRVPDPNWRD